MRDWMMKDLHRMDEMARQLEELESELSVGWDSPAAQAFIRKIRLLKDSIHTSREVLCQSDHAKIQS